MRSANPEVTAAEQKLYLLIAQFEIVENLEKFSNSLISYQNPKYSFWRCKNMSL